MYNRTHCRNIKNKRASDIGRRADDIEWKLQFDSECELGEVMSSPGLQLLHMSGEDMYPEDDCGRISFFTFRFL
jgi:hypothetical protein